MKTQKGILDKGFERLAKVYKGSQFEDMDELDPSMVVDDGEFQPDAEELVLFIDNDGDLYRQQTVPIMKNLAKKIEKGAFDYDKSIQLWMYLVDAGAKKYVQDMQGYDMPWHKVFPKSVRMEAAQIMADNFQAGWQSGDYADVLEW